MTALTDANALIRRYGLPTLQASAPSSNYQRSASGLYVPPAPSRPLHLDLFAGIGGFTAALEALGFQSIGAVEWDPAAASIYARNWAAKNLTVHYPPSEAKRLNKFVVSVLAERPENKGVPKAKLARNAPSYKEWMEAGARNGASGGTEHMWVQDIRTLTSREILDALELEPGDLGAVTGGPPCQGFSKSGGRSVMDPRNSLVFEFARLVRELKPATVFMENVVNILNMVTPEGIPVCDAVAMCISEDGYYSYEAVRKTMALQANDTFAAFRAGRESVEATPDEDDELTAAESDEPSVESPARVQAPTANGAAPKRSGRARPTKAVDITDGLF